MHWFNFPILTVMIWSGLRIYWADLRDPYVFGIGSWEIFEFFPDGVTEPLGLERRLARGMAFHFAFAWLFTINAVAFGTYLWRTGGWRNFVPTLDDLKTIPSVLMHECGLKKEAPPQGKYNGVQQLSYGIILLMGVLAIVTGFILYKPTQLNPLLTLLGGYESVRFMHFAVTIGFLLFFVIHLAQVARAGLGGLFSMVTGFELLPSAQSPRNATFVRRVNARIRDAVSVFGVATLTVLAIAVFDSDQSPSWFRWTWLAAAFGFLLEAAWVAIRGTTSGKQYWGLAVRRQGSENQKPSIGAALLRALPWPVAVFATYFAATLDSTVVRILLAAFVVVLVGIWSGFVASQNQRRTPSDVWARTVVVDQSAVAEQTHTDTPVLAEETR